MGAHGVLVTEEDVAIGTALREYDLRGHRCERTFGEGAFKAQAEGTALWRCPDGSGYWLAEHLGGFAGAKVGNTDGVWLNHAAAKAFPRGGLFAVRDDTAVWAFDWKRIAEALALREDCAG